MGCPGRTRGPGYHPAQRRSPTRSLTMNHVTLARRFAITLLAMGAALVLGIPDAYAQPETPQWFSIDKVTWNATRFLIEQRVQFGIATAAENASFLLRTELRVMDLAGN